MAVIWFDFDKKTRFQRDELRDRIDGAIATVCFMNNKK
ncbi:hypothetical protein QY97_00275 [Bacillus thermotolerans]|nr:hypothetical protein QY97_00275 [Bacillus thermotolerans]